MSAHARDRRDWTMYVWLIYLSFFLMYPALKPHASVFEWVATVAGAVAFIALYVRGYTVEGRAIVPVIVAITLLGVVFFPSNAGAGSFFIYAAGFAGRIGPGSAGVWTIVAIEVLTVGEILVLHTPIYNAVWPPLFVAIIGAVNMHYEQLHRSNHRLRLAQDEIERLAKVAERERIARDLHDLLGHTLSLIVLKSELASKLADRDPQRAREEIRDVERISRDALTQVRQAVGGFRSGGLPQELEQVKAMLRAASIECTATLAPVPLTAAQEAILSLALREAVTNVVRHARAKHCAIDMTADDGAVRLRVTDDGVGGASIEGHGLIGMRERISAIGGTLVRETTNGTTLTMTIPRDRSLERSA